MPAPLFEKKYHENENVGDIADLILAVLFIVCSFVFLIKNNSATVCLISYPAAKPFQTTPKHSGVLLARSKIVTFV